MPVQQRVAGETSQNAAAEEPQTPAQHVATHEEEGVGLEADRVAEPLSRGTDHEVHVVENAGAAHAAFQAKGNDESKRTER